MSRRPELKETTRRESFLQMHAVISTLIQHDPPEWHLRQLPDAVILGFHDAFDKYAEATEREWIRRQMEGEGMVRTVMDAVWWLILVGTLLGMAFFAVAIWDGLT